MREALIVFIFTVVVILGAVAAIIIFSALNFPDDQGRD